MAGPMVGYRDDELFPHPRARVWQLLEAHVDDATISRIHPLILRQKTVGKSGDETTVDRTIKAGRREVHSRWKITMRPPDFARWEILGGTGPYASGSWIENTYAEEATQTRIRSHGEVKISVVPFFVPQGRIVRGVFDTVGAEDQAFLRSAP
jgi:hypothetical protein